VQVGRDQPGVGDHSWPADPQMARSPSKVCLAPSSRPSWPVRRAAGSDRPGRSGRPAWEAVQHGDGRVEVDLGEQLLAELGLDRPQVGRLTHQGGPVDRRQGPGTSRGRGGGSGRRGPCRCRCPGTRRPIRWSGLRCRTAPAGAALPHAPTSQPVIDQAVHRDEQRRSSAGMSSTLGYGTGSTSASPTPPPGRWGGGSPTGRSTTTSSPSTGTRRGSQYGGVIAGLE
jgi:hypothetical protein